MRDAPPWSRLLDLLDAAERSGLLRHALDAHAVSCGTTRGLAEAGEASLRKRIEELLQRRCQAGPWTDAGCEAWALTNDASLSELFAALGLDGRLRRHARPLGQRGEADVIRSLAGELALGTGRDVGLPVRLSNEGGLLRREMLQEMALALVRVHADQLPSIAPEEIDCALSNQLRSGSISAAIARLQDLQQAQDPMVRHRIVNTIVVVLPELSELRLRVFVQLLHTLCRPSARGSYGPDAERAAERAKALASVVVQGTLAAGLRSLPYETPEQVRDMQRSPYLSAAERGRLVALFVPAWSGAPLAPPCAAAAPGLVSRHSAPAACPAGPALGSGSPLAAASDNAAMHRLIAELPPRLPPWAHREPQAAQELLSQRQDADFAECLGRAAARFRGMAAAATRGTGVYA